MDMPNLLRAFALASRVANLNPEAGEIGAGMLASLVADARAITTPPPAELLPAALDAADATLLREILAISVDPDKYTVFAAIVADLRLDTPTTVDAARAQIQSSIDQFKREATS